MAWNLVSFESAEDAMDDSGVPGISTPEHWSDVGPLSSRLQLVEQQVQQVQAHISTLSSQVAVMGHSMQQVELQLMMQQKQHEDLMKVIVNYLAGPQDGPQAPVPPAAAPPAARKARPGPRERQRLRQAEASNGVPGGEVEDARSEVHQPQPSAPPEVPPEALQPPAAPSPRAAPAAPAVLGKGPWMLAPRTSWFLVILMWFVYLAMRDGGAAPSRWDEEDFGLGSSVQPWDAEARRLRELGHLQLSVSDCQGAAQLFAKAHEVANSTLNLEELQFLRHDLGFALICAHRFEEAIQVLSQFEAVDLPVHLLNALGFAHFHQKDLAQAADRWTEALQMAPHNPVLWNNLGAARLLLGDHPGATEALLRALQHAEQLRTAAGRYYLQLVSNNIHTQRRHGLTLPVSSGDLHVEIFHCVAEDISLMVSKGTSDLVQQYKPVELAAAAEGVDVSRVEETRKAVLASEREYLLCP